MQQQKMFMVIHAIRTQAQHHWPLLVSLVVPFIILGPLLAPGYILSYDMVFSPHVHINIHSTLEGYGSYNGLVVRLALKLLSFILPMAITQKLILIAIFFLAIYGLYCALPLQSKAARLLAGLMYGINPFVYDRLMAGHWQFLLGYALTPFALIVFWRLFRDPTKKTAIVAAIVWAGVAAISSHHLIIFGVLFVGLTVAYVRTWQGVFATLAAIFGTAILSSWWLIPLLLTPNFTHSFGLGDLQTFTARPDTTYGIWPTLLSLQGFWFPGWQPLSYFVPPWLVVFALWLVPVFIGLGTLVHKDHPARRLTAGLALAALFSLLFVAGPSAGFGAATTWIFLHVPGLSGMRESQKFISLLALLYAVCAAYGLATLAGLSHRARAVGYFTLSTAAIAAVGWPLLYGASHQLTLSQYPESWQQLWRALDHTNDRALVLPYQLYLNKTFAGRLVADPALEYYGDRVVASKDPKLPGMQNYALASDQKLADSITRHDIAALQRELHSRHVHYVILLRADDLDNYLWINTLPHSVFARDQNSTILQLTAP